MPEATYYGSMSEEAMRSLSSMEGIYDLPIIEKKAPPAIPLPKRFSVWPGYVLTGVLAAMAFLIHYLPFAPFQVGSGANMRRPISAAIIAIVAGFLVRNLYPVPMYVMEGCKSIVKKAVPMTIVLTGAGLNLALIPTVGAKALLITLACIGLATVSSYYLGLALGLWPKTALLIGAGTAICGNSAIVAVAPLIDAKDEDVTLSVGTVNVLGLVLMFALPMAGGYLALGDDAFGIWAGTTIHAVPQVVAAGFAYSQKAGAMATLIKLVRVTLLAPFMIALLLVYRRQREGVTVHYSRMVPPFVWGFMAIAVLNTASLIPSLQFHVAPWVSATQDFELKLGPMLVELGNIILTLAMAAMGLEVSIRLLAKVGGRALLTGTLAALALCVASLAMIHFVF